MAAETITATLGDVARWASDSAASLARMGWLPALKQCRGIIVKDVRDNFQGGHDPDGQPWPGLALPRARSTGKDQPLRDRGLLAASIVGQSAPGHIEQLTDTLLEIGTNLDYAHVQQTGNDGQPIKPKGKYLAIPRSPEAARVGTAHPARDFESVNGIPLTFIKTGRDKAVLVQKIAGGKLRPEDRRRGVRTGGKTKAAGERWVVHFLLVRQVTIPARRFLGFGERLIQRCEDLLAKYAAKHSDPGLNGLNGIHK